MIMNFIKKVPAGMMIIPMFIAALINTLCPQIVQIGSFTTAVFSSAGAATIIGVQLLCLGTQLQFNEMPKVLKRGGILLLSKFAIGALIGVLVGKLFGMEGIFGLTTLAVISSVTNSNGSIYLSLMTTYGDETDCATMALLTINDGPFLTLIALGASGLANVPLLALLAAIVPILVGMVLGNIDKGLKEFLEPGCSLLIPFVGFALGSSINLTNIAKGGFSGLILGVIVVLSGTFVVLCDRFIGGRPGYAGWGVSTAAGNSIAVPAIVALVDPTWAPYVATATTQVAAAVVFSAIFIPIITSWWVKKYGSPKCPITKEDGTVLGL